MKREQNTMAYRPLARKLHRSPSHIFRVLQGERKPSAELAAKMKKLGLKFKEGK